MKSLKISLFILLCTLSFMFLGNIYISKVYDNLKNKFDNIEIDIENGEWNSSYDKIIQSLNYWDNASKYLSIFIHHEEMDLINMELYKLTQYVDYKQREDSLASVHLVKIHLINMMEGQKINFQNILKI